MSRRFWFFLVIIFSVVISTACSSSQSSDDGKKEISIAFRDNGGTNPPGKLWLTEAKEEFEKENSDVTVKLVPINANEGDFFAKLALMVKSPETAPDVITEDSFMINSDASAGYLEPLDERLNAWEDWSNFEEVTKQGVTAADGKIYAVPYSTDVQGIWYNKQIFKEVGLPVPWQPKNWDDLMNAAKTIKDKAADDVIPTFLYVGKATGEATSMRTFQTLLSGTGESLYDSDEKKWVVESPAILDVLTFVDEIYSNDLGPELSLALNGQVSSLLATQYMPENKLGFVLDGSWVSSNWREQGNHPWPDALDTYEFVATPTQNGQDPGYTSMSGGWTLAIPKNSDEKDLAWEFIKLATNKKHTLSYTNKSFDMTVRTDVAKEEEYLNKPMSQYEEAAEILKYTNYRPSVDKYPGVSTQIQDAVEAVATGSMTPKEAMETFASGMERIVGAENTIRR
ncbi:extracellular solute-binding protein [Bacillus timonensis]|uniref:extracellular solute-binding protein n=1 Tax=Bacillus timonensis TaxID=1033734 RepID=UPI0002892F76|nr:extracellular solute-binding protein [Bacillus timonensis]